MNNTLNILSRVIICVSLMPFWIWYCDQPALLCFANGWNSNMEKWNPKFWIKNFKNFVKFVSQTVPSEPCRPLKIIDCIDIENWFSCINVISCWLVLTFCSSIQTGHNFLVVMKWKWETVIFWRASFSTIVEI